MPRALTALTIDGCSVGLTMKPGFMSTQNCAVGAPPSAAMAGSSRMAAMPLAGSAARRLEQVFDLRARGRVGGVFKHDRRRAPRRATAAPTQSAMPAASTVVSLPLQLDQAGLHEGGIEVEDARDRGEAVVGDDADGGARVLSANGVAQLADHAVDFLERREGARP